MENLLQQLYYNNIGIKNNSRKAFNEELEAVQLLERNQEKLKSILNTEQVELLEKLTNSFDELSTITNQEAFISGFRLGGKIAIEIFCGSSDMEIL